jgi:Ca2+/Na+ antiporter
MIASFVSNPIVILFILIFVILIGFYNINIAVLVLLLLFIILYGTTIFNNDVNNDANNDVNNNEGFTDDDSDSDDDDYDNIDYEAEEQKLLKIMKQQQSESKTDETISNIKDTIFGTMNKVKDTGESDYQKSLLENKNIQYKNEKKINKEKQKNIKNNSNSNSNSKNTNNSKKENFQTINTRAFDPTKEEDTNFLITKEILQDMINRIDYNFESNKYLKKYLKHRVEEIVDINKLLDDDDD